MIRRVVVGLLSLTLLLAGLALAQDPPGKDADDPPVRLKKKPRPDAVDQPKEEQPPKPAEPKKEEPKKEDPKKEQPKEGDEPDKPDQPEMNEAEVLNRVGKNMRTSEDRLDRAELNDSTRQVQEDILKDLDSLINQEQNGGGGGGGEQDQQNQDQQNQDNKQNQGGQKNQGGGQAKVGMGKPKGGLKGGQQQAKGGQKKQGGQQGGQKADQQVAKGQKPGQQGGGQQPGQNQPQPNQQGGGNMGGGGGKSEGEVTKLAEMYKDVWGHLPETMRAEMNAYSREQFMAKYNDLIKQYYSNVAEKSRKKD
jgi:hypothetical protein